MSGQEKAVPQQAVEAVQKPVNTWRQRVIEARAIVAKPWRRHRAALFEGYMVGAVLVFLILAVLAHTVAYFTFDVTITHAVQGYRAGWFNALMLLLTWIGFSPQSYVITLSILIFLYASGLKWEAMVAFLCVSGISVLGSAIKLIVERPRPGPDVVTVVSQLHDYSFPSGHVLYFTAFFGFLLFLVYTLLKSSWWRALLLIVLGAMVALIGISRIYAGQHWASDVLAAYALGSVWLGLSIWFYRWGKPRFFVNQPVAKESTAGK